LFGTNSPLHVPEAAVLELADGHLSPEDDAAIRFVSARDALGLDAAGAAAVGVAGASGRTQRGNAPGEGVARA
jgi:hypothetical protein